MVITCGRGVPTSYEAIGLELDLPQCISSDLQSVTVSHSENCVTGYFDYLVSSPDLTPSAICWERVWLNEGKFLVL